MDRKGIYIKRKSVLPFVHTKFLKSFVSVTTNEGPDILVKHKADCGRGVVSRFNSATRRGGLRRVLYPEWAVILRSWDVRDNCDLRVSSRTTTFKVWGVR